MRQAALEAARIELTVKLTSIILYELYLFQGLYHSWLFRGYLALFLIILLATREDRLSFLLPLLQPPLLYLPLAFLVYYLAFRPYFSARSYIRHISLKSASVNYIFSADGIKINRASSNSDYKWGAIDKAKQTSRLFLLYAGGVAFVIPKRSFVSVQQLANFRSLVSRNVPKNRGVTA